MKISSDDVVFDALITKAAKQNIDMLNDYGENDPFTETPEFEKMMDEVYKAIDKNVKKLSRKKRGPRFIAVVAAIMTLLIVTVSLNASAISVFLYKSYVDIRGEILQIETDEADMYRQYNGISNFKLKDKILVPGWLPKGAELVDIADNNYALIFSYEYNDKDIIFSQQVVPQNIDSSEKDFYLERSEYEYIENYVGKTSVYFLKIKGDTGNEAYSVIWDDGQISYKLKVCGPEILLKTILEFIKPIFVK